MSISDSIQNRIQHKIKREKGQERAGKGGGIQEYEVVWFLEGELDWQQGQLNPGRRERGETGV